MRVLSVGPLAAGLLLVGCTGTRGPVLPSERFSNTVWQETCLGEAPEQTLLRFLPDGTFAYSTGGLDPGDFRHDGDDRWGIVEQTLVVTWDGQAESARTTQYRQSEDADVFVGTSARTCGGAARLERVE